MEVEIMSKKGKKMPMDAGKMPMDKVEKKFPDEKYPAKKSKKGK
jgi:hypothetical protein